MKGVFQATHRITAASTAGNVMYLIASNIVVVEVLSCSVTCEETVNQQILVKLHRAVGNAVGVAVSSQSLEAVSLGAQSAILGSPFTLAPTDGNIVFQEAANALGGWYFAPQGGEQIIVPPNGGIAIKFVNDMDAADFTIRMTFREIG